MNASLKDPDYFREVQTFQQPWIWTLLMVMSLAAVVCFGYGMIKQLGFGQPWGNRPLSDNALAIVGPLVIFFAFGVTYLFAKLKLIVEVRDDGLYIRFFPLSRKIIRYEDIEESYVRTYSPLKEYGGWGIRYSRKGKAYNVSGNQGVQLKLSGGKQLLIGSQQPEKLADAIAQRLRSQNVP
jgi:hypothetical protein